MSQYQNPCINCKQQIEMSDRNSGKWLPFNLDGTLHRLHRKTTEQYRDQEGEERVFYCGAKASKIGAYNIGPKEMKAKPTWEYFTERGERKKKLKIATVTGREAQALHNDSAEIVSSYSKGVLELYMEETRLISISLPRIKHRIT